MTHTPRKFLRIDTRSPGASSGIGRALSAQGFIPLRGRHRNTATINAELPNLLLWYALRLWLASRRLESVPRPGVIFRPRHHVQGCHAARRVSPRPQRSSLPRVPAPLPLPCPALTFLSSLSRIVDWLPPLAGLDFEASILRTDAFTSTPVLPGAHGRSLHSVLFSSRVSSLQPLEGLPPSHPCLTFSRTPGLRSRAHRQSFWPSTSSQLL